MASTIADLPAELIEAVLIVSAASENPNSIAALSQTSKFFHDLIYRCPDQHLWREIFLTTFDDPRPALNHLSTISGGHPSREFDWTQEYIDRISAARCIRRPAQLTAPVCSQPEALGIPASLSVLKALLSVITTSMPFPSSPPISLTILTEFPESNSPYAPMFNSPPFPPLLLLLTADYTGMLKSVNVTWLQELLEIGFPPELTRTLLAKLSFDVQGHAPHHPVLTPASHWDGSELGQLFHKLICCTGFIPISAPAPELADPSTPNSPGPADIPVPGAWPVASASDEDEDLPPLPITRPRPMLYTAVEQSADARTLARRRVYDMRYIGPARMWGPYQHVQRDPNSSPESNQPESPDDDEDETNEDDEDIDEDDLGLLNLGLMNGNRVPDLSPPIQPYELVPDYVWLASARIVVEANLRDVFRLSPDPTAFSTGDILPYMRKMHTMCIGGSPGYWEAWANRPEKGEGSEKSGKSKQGEVEGWDWAGISGTWKRCVCWLDYRELLVHNLAPERFLEDGMQEACRIIPLAIRITGYSESPIPPGSTTRPLPTIHVEGESIGSDRSLNDLRKIKGTVSVIGNGAIRWQMVSFAPGSNEPEWSSEAVQIGGSGAAVGFLGMWTGALHERPDPLGPFWAWKVA
ncbi:hypothetical protein DEU56DRAFT_87385 [Suillus clintonianus]|uniref:uncharacterized protein n=1 Tax=Suillus clintonianus TaxID=1904413 RepID=UPI001B86A396|nr:uncharacterized protein DEU56DRAFT_87385 [Suillus clintonianus]KAG2148968.1 hypothetical protein DEU56DRAFT_87385 [Suillus clintonianus]